jgi:hypothetical protein
MRLLLCHAPNPNTVAACNIPQTTTRFPAPGLGPAEIFYQCFGLVCWHTADTQGSDLSPSSQPLESNSNFPAFGLGEDKDIFLAFLIANAGSENVDARQFSTLFQSVISNGTRICYSRGEIRTSSTTTERIDWTD